MRAAAVTELLTKVIGETLLKSAARDEVCSWGHFESSGDKPR